MSRQYTSFAVPRGSLGELTALCEQFIDAMYKCQDDCQVLENQLYRRADAVALARSTFPDRPTRGGFSAAYSFIHAKVTKTANKIVLTPEDCQKMSRALAALRERVPDEDVLVRRMHRYKLGDVEPRHVREGWHALLRALEQAVELDAGLLWASYEEGAEEKLEAKRRADEARREAWAREPRLSPEERERAVRELEEEMRQLVEHGRQMAWDAERRRERERALAAWRTLYVVPAEALDSLRAARPRARTALARVKAFDATVAEHALASLGFEHPDERATLEVLLQILGIHTYPRGKWGVDFHDPARVAKLAPELTAWTRSGAGGVQASIGALAAAAQSAEEAPCATAYHGVRALLAQARKRRAGLIVTTFVSRRGAAAEP